MAFHFGRDQCGRFEQAITHEWLVTNGIGGFASGTLCETNTRHYHGLLMAAFSPPVARTLLLAALDVKVFYGAERYALCSHEYSDGTVEPHGYLQLESFYLDQGLPVWHYAFADALIEKRLLMVPGKNTTYVHFKVLRASAVMNIELKPLCTYRDYHSQTQGGWDMTIHTIPHGFEVEAFTGATTYRVSCAAASFTQDPVWYWHFKHRRESERGLDNSEDLYCPGHFNLELAQGKQVAVVLSAEADADISFASLQRQIHKRQQALIKPLSVATPHWVQQLTLAADQFIVERYQHNQPVGKTIIAGYPWFSDWGRDTMIALPGLTLSTQRFDIAASILSTFAAHVSEGMLPNRFPDNSATAPEYNTADATLWYFHALDQYTKHSGDMRVATELYPVLSDIIDWHRSGTRYGINVDPDDGLLFAGEAGVQLTWMDAKVGERVVTPRIGKAVEINALWYNALYVMAGLSIQLGKTAQATAYQSAAGQMKIHFQRFWNPARGCLYDVIDGPVGEAGNDGRNYDDSLRPNQLFAVALPYSPLDASQQKSIVDVCARLLLTSHGLRSLAPGEPGYVDYYCGGPAQRDDAYHQGTVWAWLMGAFVDAHYRVYHDADQIRAFLQPLGLHLSAACVGSISEIFDAEPPFEPRGCFAQAWSVAEVLRCWLAYVEPAHTETKPLQNKSVLK